MDGKEVISAREEQNKSGSNDIITAACMPVASLYMKPLSSFSIFPTAL